MNLTELANKFGSDKGTIHGDPPHKYTYLYDLIFSPFRDQAINFLEMGLAVGGPEVGGAVDRRVMSPSIAMWTDYFSKAAIYGFDISDFSHIEHPRFQFVRGDSGSSVDIARLAETCPNFDIVVDDASHASYHQQLALKYLWPKISSQGLYIIEDLQWQSPTFENSMPSVPKTAEFLLAYFQDNRYKPNDVLQEKVISSIKDQVYSFSSFSALDGSLSHPKQIVLRKK